MTHREAITEAMTWLGQQPNTLFLGQSVAFPGTGMFDTLAGVPMAKRIEMPVAEEMQMGISTGLSLQGIVPVSIFPRWNFLLLAANQLVNHLDRIPLYSTYRPKVIVRVAIGASSPLDPGPQHKDDFTEAFRLMLKTVNVVRLEKPTHILLAYQQAYRAKVSTILVERGDWR